MDRLGRSQDNEVPFDVRLRFWRSFTRLRHRGDMDLLIRDAKLGGKPRKGWNNVVKHQVAQAATFRVLARALSIPSDQAERQERFAFLHDARKHLDIAPQDFSDDERRSLDAKLGAIFAEIDPSGALRTATSEEFFYEIFERAPGESLDEKLSNVPQEEILQYYLDGVFLESDIVSPMLRIAKTEARRQDLNDDPERTKRLGMKYWDAERAIAEKVQQMIWEWLSERGARVRLPQDVPEFLQSGLAAEMRSTQGRTVL